MACNQATRLIKYSFLWSGINNLNRVIIDAIRKIQINKIMDASK